MTGQADLMDVPVLSGRRAPDRPAPRYLISVADDAGTLGAYRRLRRSVFVEEQGLFTDNDLDDADEDPRTVVLVARDPVGSVLGGVRLSPVTPGRDLGWWTGSRLAVAPEARSIGGIGAALVRAACAQAESRGVLRFEATVQPQNEVLFRRLGWEALGSVTIAGLGHVRMRWPIGRIDRAATACKAFLAPLLQPLEGARRRQPPVIGGTAFAGDDAAPVPGTDLVAACDAILPAIVERDPEWAGWCAVLVNINDLSAMGAEAVGLLDALGARDASFARRVLAGLQQGADAWGAPILGGHTTLGVAAALSVTALGRTAAPVPGGGGRVGHALTVTSDLSGGWRRGYAGAQWDSSSGRRSHELATLAGLVRRAGPAAAKDISMAGLAGTAGMLAEASGCGAVLDVARIPVPSTATMGDWLTCFPGFGMVTADPPGSSRMQCPLVHSAECGELTPGAGVHLRWPDGEVTPAVAGTVTGLGPSTP